jgi:large subunit ribosomal protein L10
MNRDEKAQAIEEIAAQIEGAEAIFAVDYRGISVPQAAELRGKLREADASFRVVKNRLTKRAADQAGEDRLKSIARLPTREVLDGQLAGIVASPLTGLVRGLGSMVSGLANQLQQLQEQKEKEE